MVQRSTILIADLTGYTRFLSTTELEHSSHILNELLELIVEADTLGLTEKEYAAELGYDSFSLAGSTGSVCSYEGSGTPNVAWCSGLAIEGARASISAFCGPLTDVPIASVSPEPGKIVFFVVGGDLSGLETGFGNDSGGKSRINTTVCE